MLKTDVQFLLRKYNIRPNDEKGQNFLISDKVLDGILAEASVTPNDTILEIGPGIGNLTTRLAAVAQKVVAVEIDHRFKPTLDAVVRMNNNIVVLYDDILSLRFDVIANAAALKGDGGYNIVANIPYYITSHLIRQILSYPMLPQRAVLLIQKEVAERIVAKPGDHSKLSLSVQCYGTPRIAFKVPKENFYPTPKVDSALLVIDDIHRWHFDEPEKLVWQLIAIGFSSKRKKLINNLIAGLHLDRAQALELLHKALIPENARAEDVSVEEWRALARVKLH